MNRIFLFCVPTHSNLGDQAQLMCTEHWIKKSFPDYKLVKMTELFVPFDNGYKRFFNIKALLKYLFLKIRVRKNDIFIGHSGYFFVDHHSGWFTYDFLVKHFPQRFIILPQTINFYTPVVKQMFTRDFDNKTNLTILCRDEVSYNNAEKLIPHTKHILYPDIVTSLIGTRTYNHKRSGVLFCMRNDIEAYYSKDEIKGLSNRFGNIRKERIDTSIKVSTKELKKNRDQYIDDMIQKIATYRVVITDRYHGTIFSAIASTPVIVLNSADHKLSSGVNWFPRDIYGKAVQFANSLDEAYALANEILHLESEFHNPPYFKCEYWDKLKLLLDK